MEASTSTFLDELRPVLSSLRSDSASLVSAVQSALPLDSDMLETAQGPSLLTLKNAALLNYLHHLVILSAARLRGRSLDIQYADGGAAGIVRNLIELRLVLEKIRPVEGRMRGLVERLARAADEEDKRIREGRVDEDEMGGGLTNGRSGVTTAALDDEVDPLAFRPNVAALSAVAADAAMETRGRAGRDGKASRDCGGNDGIYRPPRLAPVVYNPDQVSTTGRGSKAGKERVAPRNAALLSDLSASMSGNPYEVSSAGVGVGGSGGAGGSAASSRAKALSRMQQYEEDNFTRLTMSKKDANRRRRDEADVALGGAGMSTKRGRVGAGLEEEFGDLLRNRSSTSDLRGGKRSSALQRSRSAGQSGDGSDVFGIDARGGHGGGGGGGVFQRKMRNDARRRGGGGSGGKRR